MGYVMVTTVRLNDTLEKKLDNMSKKLHKKKSDIIREAISFYSDSLESSKKSRIQSAIKKTVKKDLEVYNSIEGSLSDSL
jgi:predicted DNA-binding protein